MANFLKTMKRWWMAFAEAVGWFNTRLLLTVFYFVVLALPALVLKLLRKDLLDRSFRDRDSYWIQKEKDHHSIDEAKRQF